MPRSFRYLILYKNKYKKVFNVSFTKNDASLYISPYSPKARFDCGVGYFQENQVKTQVTCYTQNTPKDFLKLSIHESGQVHIKNSNNSILGETLSIPHFKELNGEHIATIDVGSIESLVDLKGKPKQNNQKHDIVFAPGIESKTIRFALYLNGKEKKFKCDLPDACITLKRNRLPIYCHKTYFAGAKRLYWVDLDSWLGP